VKTKALALAFAALLTVGSYALYHYTQTGYFWHPLRNGPGYNVWSGIAGSFLTSIPGWFIALYVWIRGQNCHVHGCWRLQWHEHPDHGHPVCRRHHPHSDDDILSPENHR
jgi:hypothetical protein